MCRILTKVKDSFSHLHRSTSSILQMQRYEKSIPDVQKLCNVNDIIFLQETWLTKQNLDYLSSISDDHYAYGYTAIDDFIFYLFAIFILHSRESELYCYILDGRSALAWELSFRCLGHLSST